MKHAIAQLTTTWPEVHRNQILYSLGAKGHGSLTQGSWRLPRTQLPWITGNDGIGLVPLAGPVVLSTPQILSTYPPQTVSLPRPLAHRPSDTLVGGWGGHRWRKEQEENEEKVEQTWRPNNLLKKGEEGMQATHQNHKLVTLCSFLLPKL